MLAHLSGMSVVHDARSAYEADRLTVVVDLELGHTQPTVTKAKKRTVGIDKKFCIFKKYI